MAAAGMPAALLVRPGTVLALDRVEQDLNVVADLRDLIPFF